MEFLPLPIGERFNTVSTPNGRDFHVEGAYNHKRSFYYTHLFFINEAIRQGCNASIQAVNQARMLYSYFYFRAGHALWPVPVKSSLCPLYMYTKNHRNFHSLGIFLMFNVYFSKFK